LRKKLKTSNRIGLFGGTFDPVHTGHLIIAEAVREQAQLDVVLFIPSAQPPHKHHMLMFSANQRFTMLSDAVRDNPFFLVSEIEMNRDGTSYTIDTLREIKKELPSDADVSFIVGRDNLNDIELWKEPRAIVKECAILVADRFCDEPQPVPDWLRAKVTIIAVPRIEISSSDIRERIRAGKSIRYLVPDVVEKAIQNSK